MSDSTPPEAVAPGGAADGRSPAAAVDESETPATPGSAGDLLEREGDAAADYLEALLDIADLDGDIDMDVEGERATVSIVGDGLGRLIGPTGEVLDALQELTRLAVQQATGMRSRLMLDVGGYRARKRAELHALGVQVAQAVLGSGSPRTLDAMTPFERKVVHDAVATVDGVASESEGEEPERRIVVRKL